MTEFERTPRTTVRRLPARGNYDRDTVFAILDEGLVCHVGFSVDGKPYVIPTGYGRDGDRLLIHGSVASRMLRTLATGIEVCVTVTILDGLVLARSAFHHSMNYRSVLVFGTAREIISLDERMEALRILVEHLAPGRWETSRMPTDAELRSTAVLELPLLECSAKIRTGPPVDDEDDLDSAYWAGEVELRLLPIAIKPDPELRAAVSPPALTAFDRSQIHRVRR